MLNYVAIGFVMISMPIQFFFLRAVLKRELREELKQVIQNEMRSIIAPVIQAELRLQLDDKIGGVLMKLDQRTQKLLVLDQDIQKLVNIVGETVGKIDSIAKLMPGFMGMEKTNVGRR